MSKCTRKNTAKVDVYEEVNNRILAMLEEGTIPWNRPWELGATGCYNMSRNYDYNLLNNLMLEHSPFKEGETDFGYVPASDLNKLGVRLKKDEDGNYPKHEIVYGIFRTTELVTDKDGNPVIDDDGEQETRDRFNIRRFAVYWENDIEWGEVKKPTRKNKTHDFSPIEDAENTIKNYTEREHISFFNTEPSNRAYYNPTEDCIKLPMKAQFKDPNRYYSTAFHEMVHSTGHETRLNRDIRNVFGDHKYSQEELVAEMGASYLCAQLGIENSKTIKNSTAYIQSWMEALKNDKKLFYRACGQAEKAVNYILEKSGH